MSSCDSEFFNTYVNNPDGKDDSEYVLYTDSDPIENDKVKIECSKPNCFGSGSCSFRLAITITNKEYVTREYKFKNIKLIKESTGAEYTVSEDSTTSSPLTIDAELHKYLVLVSTIPSSTDDDNYRLTLNINGYKNIYYLYESPDELRVDRNVNYYISISLVKTDIVKNKRKIEQLFVYETLDNLYYCDTWYTDVNLKNKFESTTLENSNINLYGRTLSNIKWSTPTNVNDIPGVDGVNHVPSNGVLIIPPMHDNKEIYIGLFAIKDISVSVIYVPKTVHTIYYGNFTGIGNAIIYYEGTEEEWENLFASTSSIVKKNVVFNTAYDG